MIGQKLYKAEWVGTGAEQEECYDHEGCACFDSVPEPAGWREYALERWGTEPGDGESWPDGHKPFFWPATDRVFRSRSSAQRRVGIINYWGGRAVVVECTPVWETVESANARRQAERLRSRIDRKRAELDELLRQQGDVLVEVGA